MYQFELMRDARILMNNKKYDLAVKPLLEIRENSVEDDFLETKYLLLSACYQNLGNHQESLNWADKAVQANKSSEFASITKCEAYRTMEQYQEAYNEMLAFSENNKLGLYQVVLLRFLKDIDLGIITDPNLIENVNILVNKNLDKERILKYSTNNAEESPVQ